MPRSIESRDVHELFKRAQIGRTKYTPSPEDWRDHWIYFLITDRFNNPDASPREPWDAPVGTFQGGTFNGIREQLDYLKDLGVGALWISPVLKNPQYDGTAHHGYGVQDFLAIEPRFASDPVQARLHPELAEKELRELVDVVPDTLVRGVEEVRAVTVHLDAGLRLGLRIGVAADVWPSLDDENALVQLRCHTLGNRQAEESGTDDKEVETSCHRQQGYPTATL